MPPILRGSNKQQMYGNFERAHNACILRGNTMTPGVTRRPENQAIPPTNQSAPVGRGKCEMCSDYRYKANVPGLIFAWMKIDGKSQLFWMQGCWVLSDGLMTNLSIDFWAKVQVTR